MSSGRKAPTTSVEACGMAVGLPLLAPARSLQEPLSLDPDRPFSALDRLNTFACPQQLESSRAASCPRLRCGLAALLSAPVCPCGRQTAGPGAPCSRLRRRDAVGGLACSPAQRLW